MLSEEDIKHHGLVTVDGDLLTVLLMDKVKAGQWDDVEVSEGLQYTIHQMGLFHAKMAACHLLTNWHWGTPNLRWSGSLWKENNVLGCKEIAARWKSKKHAPWMTTHELLGISLATHVYDAFQIVSGQSIEHWVEEVTFDDFERVAHVVLGKFFSTSTIAQLWSSPMDERDFGHENTLLLNWDNLIYTEFCHAIKCGDIGCILNVARIECQSIHSQFIKLYLTSMTIQTSSSMYPSYIWFSVNNCKYSNIYLHNWLVNMTGRASHFKELDLLQEHQNFWAKVWYCNLMCAWTISIDSI